MPVDDRIRAALAERADGFTPSVETSLESVRRRGRRAGWYAAAVATTGVAAVGVIAVTAWWRLAAPPDEASPADVPRTTTATSRAAPEPLRGRISADVDAPSRLRGTWVVELKGNGTLDVEERPGQPPATTALFVADGTTMSTTLLDDDLCAGDGTGIYDWLAVGDRVEFTVVSDSCRSRVRFFEEPVWTVSTPQAPRG